MLPDAVLVMRLEFSACWLEACQTETQVSRSRSLGGRTRELGVALLEVNYRNRSFTAATYAFGSVVLRNRIDDRMTRKERKI